MRKCCRSHITIRIIGEMKEIIIRIYSSMNQPVSNLINNSNNLWKRNGLNFRNNRNTSTNMPTNFIHRNNHNMPNNFNNNGINNPYNINNNYLNNRNNNNYKINNN